MTGTLFDYYDTSPTNTVLKFRLEGPVLDNCGFAMVNRQLWFGLSIRQQLRHNWRSALPNPYDKDFEIEVQVSALTFHSISQRQFWVGLVTFVLLTLLSSSLSESKKLSWSGRKRVNESLDKKSSQISESISYIRV